ncbi:MAG: hypothetical protein Q4E86_10620, partial [Lachnospiraceae bacterium]|nr:hypothetical protein [Lachnospiraceae bacterium]
QKLESPEEAPSFVAASDLFLYLLESDFFIGQQGELSFTVLYGSEITGPITITDETGALLCTLENDGSGMVLGTCPIFGENPRSGALTASSGAWESDAAHFYVQPEITDEMMDRLFQVGEDVSSAIETAGYEDPYSEAAFAFVQDTLEEHPDVAFVGTNNDVLLFETTDHLAGCYGLSADYENQLTFGGFSDINSAFEEWINGDFVSDQVISSGAPSTNSRYLFTSPFTGDRLIDVAAPMYSEMMENLAERVDGTCQSVMGNGAYSLLRSGAFTDAGFWMHCTHGKPMLRSDGTNMLFSALFDATVDEVSDILGTDRQMFYHSRHTLWDEAVTEDNGDGRTRFVGADTYRMVYEVISDDTDRIWTSTRFLEDCLGDQIFDNTIIYFCVCFAYSDPVLKNLLLSHGASAFMGCEQSLDAGLATSFWNQLSTFLGTRDENEEYYALLQALNSMTYSKNDACVQELYQSLYRGKNMTAEEHEESMTENLDDYIDAAVHAPISCVMRGEGGSRVLAGSSVLSGSVLTEQDSDNEEAAVGVEDATVTLYRWLDHDFHKQGEQQTDQNGIYQLDHLDYGMYIAHAEKDGLESYRSIVVSKSGIQAEPIYLGILISGEVLDEDTELPLSDAEVALVSALGFKGETAADPDGCWEMLIPAASCEASFSCSGYQDKGMMISKSDLDGGTRHFQIYLKKEINYYKFIRDELLPDMGYANLAAASRTVTPNQSWSSALGWDIRKGLLGADIADLDKDGTDDLLVYFFDASAVSDVYSAIYASLYTISEDNEIILVNT